MTKADKKTTWICRGVIGVLTIAIVATIGGLVGYYIGIGTLPPADVIDGPSCNSSDPDDVYYVGVARRDVTGPIVQVNMMGYAHPEQVANGLHTRLYSRAFVVADHTRRSRVAFVSFDGGMASQLMKGKIVGKLRERIGNDTFSERNVVISGTHTHSGPAGFFQFLLFEITSLGHVTQATDSFVDGIVDSIVAANSDLQESHIYIGKGKVNDANINRSPTSYLRNPEQERMKYEADTEQEMTLLKIETTQGEGIGMVCWYPAHPTSMNFTNRLISSDHKGRASSLFEKGRRREGETLLGKERYVAAFANANLGDVSPRTNGAICVETENSTSAGQQCDAESSTCDGRSQGCVAFGPGRDMFDSTDIIARRQLQAALDIYDSAQTKLSGPVDWIHQYVDMSSAKATTEDGETVSSCPPGLGYSFAAGCTDGAGAFDFVQGMTNGTPFWDTVRDALVNLICTQPPPAEYYACHQPKPVLLPTAYMDRPRAWHPSIVEVQMLMIGQIVIAAVPGEFSTMAGRRLKEAIGKEVAAAKPSQAPEVVIAGLSNVYTHYITTAEEYSAQRYEAASTIYGPNTLTVYTEKYKELARSMLQSPPGEGISDPGPVPDIEEAPPFPLAPEPGWDSGLLGVEIGDIIVNANATYKVGSTVTVVFQGANPRQNLKLDETYLEIQRRSESDLADWSTVYTDTDWETKFTWTEENPAAPSPPDVTLFTSLFDVIADVTGKRLEVEKLVRMRDQARSDESDALNFVDDGSLLEQLTDAGMLRHDWTTPYRATNGASYVTIEWEIPEDEQEGVYRVVYFGNSRSRTGELTSFSSAGGPFSVSSN